MRGRACARSACRGGDPLRRRQRAHPAADADRQPDRHAAGHRRRPAAAVHDAPRHGAAVRRGRAGAQARPHHPAGPDARWAATTAPAAPCWSRWRRRCSKQKLPHPPLTLLFTVREESGLFGATSPRTRPTSAARRWASTSMAATPADITIGAVGAERWEVEIIGKASHAGVHPEQGISATLSWRRWRWPRSTRAAGSARVVTGRQGGHVATSAASAARRPQRRRGDQRRHRLRPHHAASRAATTRGSSRRSPTRTRTPSSSAASAVTDDKGKPAKVKFTSRLDYYPFRLKDDAPVVREARGGGEGRAEADAHRIEQRRPRRQLAGQARHPDGHLRRRARTRSTPSRSTSI